MVVSQSVQQMIIELLINIINNFLFFSVERTGNPSVSFLRTISNESHKTIARLNLQHSSMLPLLPAKNEANASNPLQIKCNEIQQEIMLEGILWAVIIEQIGQWGNVMLDPRTIVFAKKLCFYVSE